MSSTKRFLISLLRQLALPSIRPIPPAEVEAREHRRDEREGGGENAVDPMERDEDEGTQKADSAYGVDETGCAGCLGSWRADVAKGTR